MSNMFETVHLAAQTGRVFLVLAAAFLVVWLIISISAKLLGVVLAAAGLATLIWFPGYSEHQPVEFRSAAIKIGALLVGIGLLLILFG